tara:strand:+ start:130 stop:912 length:783 start_codon:yes stop_codon:yes gene_type:complete
MNLKEKYIRYFGNIVEQDDVMDKEIENPETGNKIKVKTAMQLPDSHPAHKEAEKLIGGEKAKPSGDKEKEKVKGQDLFKKDTKKSDKPKSDKPVELDDYGQEAIDSMDWNRYDDQGITNVTKVINDLDDNVDEWNQQIYNTVEELEGQIPQEDIDKLYSAEVNVMDLDDEALSEVPRKELEKKTKTLIDFHKKYSTIGKRTTAQEKDPNRKKVSGIKPGSSFGSNIGYRTGRNRGGGMYDNVNKSSNKKLQEIIEKTTNI